MSDHYPTDHGDFISLHVLTKNVQGVRDENRVKDFVAEFDLLDF